jgi:hypothetical protein
MNGWVAAIILFTSLLNALGSSFVYLGSRNNRRTVDLLSEQQRLLQISYGSSRSGRRIPPNPE